MERKTRKRPTVTQSGLSTTLLITISALISPLTLLITMIAFSASALAGEALNYIGARRRRATSRKTILLTGGRANKALTLLRAFKREGHRVILAEEARWGALTCARFSRGVDTYYSLPDPLAEPTAYGYAIKRIVTSEHVDAWVPCSSVHATMVDSEVAMEIRLGCLGGSNGCKSFIPEPHVAGALHWKDQFEDLCRTLQFPMPDSKVITSVSNAADFLHSPETLAKGYRYLLKSLGLDDLGRDDFTLFPLSTREATVAHLSQIPTPISESHPFLLQRFLNGAEYCTHVAARDGQVVAFVACPSNPLLMRYCDVRTFGFGLAEGAAGDLERWTQHFLDLYKAKLQSEGKEGPQYELTGHFSFDFIIEETEDTIYPLECNVRAHTAVCLFSDCPTLASHYLGPDPTHISSSSSEHSPIARPGPSAAPRSWVAHALPLTLARLLPRGWMHVIHPQLESTVYPPPGYPDPTASPPPDEGPVRVLWRYLSGAEQDGVWDWTDPIPFFILCHVQWPWLLLRLMWRGVAWSRVNVSTSRIFEC